MSAAVLDEADRVASSWRSRYDSLRPTPGAASPTCPDVPTSGHADPSRDQVIEHIERHAGEEGMELRLGTRVERIERDDEGWVVHTSADELRAPR